MYWKQNDSVVVVVEWAAVPDDGIATERNRHPHIRTHIATTAATVEQNPLSNLPPLIWLPGYTGRLAPAQGRIKTHSPEPKPIPIQLFTILSPDRENKTCTLHPHRGRVVEKLYRASLYKTLKKYGKYQKYSLV